MRAGGKAASDATNELISAQAQGTLPGPLQDPKVIGPVMKSVWSQYTTTAEQFNDLIAHAKSCGVNVIGPFSLGHPFWSAYLFDPNGIRLEFATRLGDEESVVESARQTEEEARAELETLLDDPAEIDRWLAEMPLKRD